MIKTLKESELKLLTKKGILEKYCAHLQKHPKSLLSRFYSVLKIKIKFMHPINIIIMDNLMGEHMEEAIRVYDLKGSTFQRINQNPSKDTSVRKDLNFLEDKSFRMMVSNHVKTDILKRMERDKEFLKSCNLMDYSLLIVFFKKGGNRGQTSNLSFSRKVSVVVR